MSEPIAAAATGGRPSAAREFFAQLRKGAKAIAMYRHNPGRFAEILKPACAAATALLEPGPLMVRVTTEAFLVEDQEVWQAEGADNVPFRFYREGIRQLVLRPGLTDEELSKFVLILLTNTERGGEEIVTQLWGASFEHVEYVAVDGFRLEEMSESEVHVEVDTLVDYLAGRLRGDSDDTIAFARISAADLDLKLEGIDQIRGALFDGEAVSAGYKARLQQELERDEREKLPARVMSLLELQLKEGAGDPGGTLELLTELADGALLREDLSPIVRALDALGRVSGLPGPGQAAAAELEKRLGGRLAEDARLRRLGEIMKARGAGLDPAVVARYLAVLDGDSVPALLDVLESLEPGPARAPVVEALARLAPRKPELLAGRLENAASGSVKDLIAIVVRGNFPDGPRYLQAALRNPNPQVKVAVVAELGSSPRPESVHRFVLEASTDKNSAVRAVAFRSMVQLSPGRAAQDLLRLPKLPDWDKRDAAERELIHVCIGQTQRTEALAYLQGLLMQKRSLLNAKKVLESKLHAIAGLQAMATLHAYKILQGLADAKDDAEVASAARKAMYAVKKVLFESAQVARPSTDAAVASADPSASAEALFDQFQSAQKEAADAAAEEKARIQAAMKARELAEFEESVRREKERQDAMARPFGMDPALLAAPPLPPPKPPREESRPATGATKITGTFPGVASARPVTETGPRIGVNGEVLPPPPPAPAAASSDDGDDLEFHIDIEGDGT